MHRALSTARLLVAGSPLAPSVDEGLVEFDHGASEYIPFEGLRDSRDVRYQQFIRGDYSAWGVDTEVFWAKVVVALEKIVEANPGGRVVVVCHGGSTPTSVMCWASPGFCSLSPTTPRSTEFEPHDPAGGRWSA